MGVDALSESRDPDPPDGGTPDGDTTTYEVADLLGVLSEVVEVAFPNDIWIRGQIRNLHRRSRWGHVYFDLVTPAPAEKPPEAVLPVVLFDWYRKIVNRTLGTTAAGQMVDGTEVRIRGRASVYAPRGQLQLRMKAIDPAYTLSRLADERDRLLAELKAAGLLEHNRSLPLPTLPLRVGLVTSANSAAEADFRDVLAAAGIGWQILVVDTPVQGFGSEQRIATALALAERRGAEVIALVRGGGSRTELAPFDSAAVAHAVAARTVPILTGIGHEIDRSVADVVAHTACNTPTACATFLVSHVGRFDRDTREVWGRIRRTVAGRLAGDRRRLSVVATRTAAAAAGSCRGARSNVRRLTLDIDRAARHGAERADWHLDGQQAVVADRAAARLADRHRQLETLTDRLRLDATVTLAAQDRMIDALAAQMRAYDPQRALDRGWSITTDDDGRLLRSVAGIMAGATLRTRLRDGTVTSIAEQVTPSEKTGSDHD